MSRSLLSFREFPAKTRSNAGTIIALHGRGGDLEQLIPLCRAAAPAFDVVAAEAPRSLIPYTAEFTLDYQGYSWYPVQDGGRPEPVRFGDNLWYVEQFVVDVLERQIPDVRPVYLLGFDEGAVLALNIAGIMPEFLAGVVSIRGYFPTVPGWSLPATDLNGLPVLIVCDSIVEDIAERMMARTTDELRWLGANLTSQSVVGIRSNPFGVKEIFSEWLRVQNDINSQRKHSGALSG